MKKNNFSKNHIKITKAFKVVLSFCLIAILLIIFTACKKAIVVEETKPPETTSLPAVSETTQETTAPTETTPKVIEYKGMVIPSIDGLRFEEGSFYTIDNRYNLPPNTEAGKAIPDAFELNGQMENSIALRPEVIEYMQKKMMEEDKEFKYPLPFDFEQAKGIKIREILMANRDKEGNLSFDIPYKNYVLGVEAPVGTKLYPPLATDLCIINSWEEFSQDGKSLGLQWVFSFRNLSSEGEFNGVKIDGRFFDINTGDVEVYPKTTSKKDVYDGAPTAEIKIGELLAKVNHETYLKTAADERQYNPPGQYQFRIDYIIRQGQNDYRLIDFWSIKDFKISLYPTQ